MKCYLVLLGIICMEVLLLNDLHACMGRMDATKICILIIINRGMAMQSWERAIHILSV